MARGFRWGIYVDDDGVEWAVKVDADYYLDPVRGWSEANPGITNQLPRGWRPRLVLGLDELGNTVNATVARTDAPAWTGESPTFTFNATDQEQHTATIIGRREERRLP